MKRILSLFLSALLLATLGVPAAAAGSETDKRLAQVTAKVKGALNIGDEYTSFSGELWENELVPVWNLGWSREGASLSVTATEGGKVLSYNFYEEEKAGSTRNEAFPPAFPAVSQEKARKLAEDFLDQVLDASLESAEFTGSNTVRINSGVYRFSGTILLNGLASPLSFSLTLRSSDGEILRFRRDSLEESVIGDVPSAKAGCSRKDAGALLKSTLALRLEYVLDEEKGTAALRYLPEPGNEYFVDARTGGLVDLTALYEETSKADGGGANNSAVMGAMDSAVPEAAPAEEEAVLSQAELEGIAKLEGVQSKEALDKLLREIPELGLDRYALASASYSLDEESGDVTARLSYTRREDTNFWRRTVSCDGRTGALLGLYSSAPYDRERRASVSESEAREKAEAFLEKLWGEEYAASALRESQAWSEGGFGASHSFTYSQRENGYFLPANTLQAAVDVTDGSISYLGRQWTENVAFDSPEGIISEEEALDAWSGHYELPLVYLNVPVKLDPSRTDIPMANALADMGYTYFYELRLAYVFAEEGIAYSVDARSGQVVRPEQGSSGEAIVYDDLDGHWAAPYLEKLAEYGVGWTGGSCRPSGELTQLDFLALLLSANGQRYDLENKEDVDSLYRSAYSMGVLTVGERDGEKLLSRGETVRLLLDAAGYGATAKLEGIFTCSYADRDEIPGELLGYAALAQGLRLVNGSFSAGRTATRAEAAMLLYNYMNR